LLQKQWKFSSEQICIKNQRLQIFMIFGHIDVDVVNFWENVHVRDKIFIFVFT
jgi:hypothetical protein